VVLYSPARTGATIRRDDWQVAHWYVAHCARAAIEAGVRPGMPLAEAQALLECLGLAHFAQHDPQADRKLLQSLANWCSRYSPLVGMEQTDEPSTLFCDVTGCAPLFGGEERMAEQIVHDFERVGYRVRVALADTPGAAWAVAHFGQVAQSGRHTPCAEFGTRSVPSILTPLVIPPGRQSVALFPLPIAALRLPEKIIDTLHELGIRQIEQLQRLPRHSLPPRFGPCVLERLNQALGRSEELILPVPPAEPIEARWSFEEPTADRSALESVLRRLIGEIAEALMIRQEGAQRLVCCLFCTGGEPIRLTIGAVHPTAAAEHLCELVRLQLERITLAGEVLAIEVEVVSTGPLETHQQEMFDSGINRDGERQLAVLLDRFSNRLGEKAVLRPKLHPDSQPEYASRFVVALRSGERAPIRREMVPPRDFRTRGRNCKLKIEKCKLKIGLEGGGSSGDLQVYSVRPAEAGITSDAASDDRFISGPAVRPLCLKPRPVPITVISIVPDGPPIRFWLPGGEHTVWQSWGPERIETGWWREAVVTRDYFRVETSTGQRFWLFRQNDGGQWFLHGEFE
jgi:protein ImuB